MVVLIVLAAVFLLILVLLLMPVSADIEYRDDFLVTVRYCGIRVYRSEQKVKEAHKKPEGKDKKPDKKAKKQSYISEVFKKKGKIEGIKFCFALFRLAFSKTVYVLKKIKFKRFELDISVASDDAAKTAVTYGALCGAIYPALDLLKINTSFDIKKVNVYTDFDKLSPEIKVSLNLKLRLIFAVIVLISTLVSYLRLKKESEKNG
ncbi:MAG: DUF2953 domain-containing protein [Clostridia bacterium]|nr:DUF2953 domain-containing protein [Clostridia bacterium]